MTDTRNISNSSKRVQSIDVLRAVAILGMILSAAVSYDACLPAWMFHCQVPPPEYVFRPEVRGITWVDLVFPFFIFALGAALPFSLGRKVEKGEPALGICLGIIKRWAVLVAFSLVIGHADAVPSCGLGAVPSALVRLGIWCALFAALLKTGKKWVNAAGWLVLASGFVALHFCCGLPLDFRQNDCIIMLLSTVALLGGFIYLFTRNSPRLRVLAWLIVVAMKLHGWDWPMYLVIALPGTLAGDLIRINGTSSTVNRPGLCACLGLVAIIVQLWGLYAREIIADAVITANLAAAFICLTYKDKGTGSRIGRMGSVLLVLGIAFDPLDGGIAKDYCNLSYLFATGGMALLLLVFLMWMEGRGALGRNLVMLGQNPMIAYTIAWFVICPLLYLVGLGGWVDGICTGAPLLGLLRGIVVTALMMAATCLFTKWKVFWRS